MQLEFSQIARKKMKVLREYLSEEFGEKKSKEIMQDIKSSLENLKEFPESGLEISKQYNIDTDYHLLFRQHNYFIYRIEEEKIIVIQIFNEREDFMQKLFGLSGRTQESIDFWGE